MFWIVMVCITNPRFMGLLSVTCLWKSVSVSAGCFRVISFLDCWCKKEKWRIEKWATFLVEMIPMWTRRKIEKFSYFKILFPEICLTGTPLMHPYSLVWHHCSRLDWEFDHFWDLKFRFKGGAKFHNFLRFLY